MQTTSKGNRKMSVIVNIKQGSYRNNEVTGKYQLVRDFQIDAKGGNIKVVSPEYGKTIKVKVTKKDFEVVSGSVNDLTPHDTPIDVPTEPIVEETKEEAIERIAARFEVLSEMTEAAINGAVTSVIVVGPPGVGKSYDVEQKLAKYGMFDQLAEQAPSYQIVKGFMTPIGLYKKLYEFSDKGKTLVFDDLDSVLEDPTSLNLLKAALDSNKERRIFWNAESRALAGENIPNDFRFRASVIFITNLKFDSKRAGKLGPHLQALRSRSHYVDLTINNERDKFLRIEQIFAQTDEETGKSVLFKDYSFNKKTGREIIDFMEENSDKLQEISLRCAVKIAELAELKPQGWQRLAKETLFR
jgi:hypothetical protein